MTKNLWRNRDFLQLWAGETVSLFGSEVTELALPLAAILVLGADAGELGLLSIRSGTAVATDMLRA